MKLVSYEAVPVDLPLREGYRIAGHTIQFVRNILVRLEADNGLIGHGGAAPAEDVTGESEEACLAALRGPLRDLGLGEGVPADPSALAEEARCIAPACPAARAALDIAFWDLAGRRASVPLVRLWGGQPRPLPTSVTIGVCGVEETLEAARRWLRQGFRILKVKIGEDVALDVERLRRLRDEVGPSVALRADANQGYTLVQARELLRGVSDLQLEMIEQPLGARALNELRELRLESNVPIFADEAACTLDQAAVIIDIGAAHGLNIKLMKCGGPSIARRIHDRARDAGLSLMLGCNDETSLSIAAATHLALALPGIAYADLDGHMDLARDPASGGLELHEGCLHLTGGAGLGVEIKPR